MKRLLWFIPVLLLLTAAGKREEGVYRMLVNDSFGAGETLTYRVHMGWLNAGEASMEIDNTTHMVNGRPCYKIDVNGHTTGLADILYKVRDNWGSYLDTISLIPQQSYRYIYEGSYRKFEIMNFDHSKDSVAVTPLDKQTMVPRKDKFFPTPDNVQDIVSGYYYIRLVDFNMIKKGDVINVDGFFDEEIYHFRVRFMGRETVDTKLGEVNAIVLSPIMDENKLFDGESSIKIWLSDDENKIPLKVRAKMFVGAVEVDIKTAENLRQPINYAD